MEAIKLSLVALSIKWATYCVDWFMDFFAEPENYWVAETYPSDTPAIAVARAINTRVKSLPKLVVWLKERLNNPFTIARINTKRLVLTLCEVCTVTYYHLYGALQIALHKDTLPIMV